MSEETNKPATVAEVMAQLAEADLLLESKILTVADVTEAKSSFRPYRPALGLKATIDELKEYRGIYVDVLDITKL